MYEGKQKDDMERIIEAVLKLEYPEVKYPDPRMLEVRPILPMDFELGSWLWTSNHVKLRASRYTVFYGIHSRYLLQVMLRTTAAGNIVAAVSTGQLLYEPYFWKKQDVRWVTWQTMEGLSAADKNAVPFSILGFVIEPAGIYIA